jgi:hypothetical protein
MARIIHIARCPRCGCDVRKDALRPAAAAWAMEDEGEEGGVWPAGRPAAVGTVAVCSACHDVLFELSREAERWRREASFYLDEP